MKGGPKTGWGLGAGVNQQPPGQADAVQAVLGMNQKHILFPCPGIFQPPSLPQNFPLLLTSSPPPPYLPPPSYLLHLISHSLHSESSRAWVAQNFKETWDTRLEKDGELNVEGMWRGESKKSAYHKCKSKRRKISSLLSLHFSLCVFLLFYVWEEEDAKEKALETKGQKHEAKSENQKWEGRLRAWR